MFITLAPEQVSFIFSIGLMFYDEPPRCQINLETMEKLALERLRFLRLIEKTNSIHGGKVWSPVMANDHPEFNVLNFNPL